MGWREFFWPRISKIIIFLLLTIIPILTIKEFIPLVPILYIILIVYLPIFMIYILGIQSRIFSSGGISIVGLGSNEGTSGLLGTGIAEKVIFCLAVIYAYVLSCVIVFLCSKIYSKIKNQ